MIRVEHLIPLISTLIQLILQIGIAKIIKIQDPIDPHLMITLLSLVKFHLLPLFMGRRVAPSRTVNEQIFWQSLNRYDLFFVLYVEGVEVPP